MAVSFPISTTLFWDEIPFAGRPEFELRQFQRSSIDGSGNILVSYFGSPKWYVDVSTTGGNHKRDASTAAYIKHLMARNGSFYAYDLSRPYPIADPLGIDVSASTVLVRDIGVDNRSISLKGLPAGYVISVGDKFSVASGTSRVLLEAVEAATANGVFNTVAFEVQPFLPSWVAIDQAVDLVKPVVKFKIVPGSYKPASASGNTRGGLSFTMASVP